MPQLESQIRTLIWKNYLISKRRSFKFCLEILFPIMISTMIMFYGNLILNTNPILISIMIPLAYLIHFRSLTSDIIIEKAEKYKEYLKINSMQQSSYVISIILSSYLKCLLILLIMSIGIIYSDLNLQANQIYIDLITHAYNIIFPFVEQIKDFIYLMIFFSISMTHFSMLFASLFNSHEIGSIVSIILYMLTPFMVISVLKSNESILMILAGFIPHNSIILGLVINQEAQGLTFPYFNENRYIMISMSIVYLLAYLYYDQVFPGNYGISKPWYFCIQRAKSDGYETIEFGEEFLNTSTTIRNSIQNDFMSRANEQQMEVQEDNEDEEEEKGDNINSSDRAEYKHIGGVRINRNHLIQCYLSMGKPQQILLFIKKLKKKYKNMVVLNDVSLKIESKQIIYLLGHNGAGKSTLFNILTGMIDFDSGDVYYHNNNLKEKLEYIRKDIGICHQCNILYDELTILEHLEFMAGLRSIHKDKIHDEINYVLDKCDLKKDRRKLVSKVSIGIKRKLSLALAILGRPSVIYLDEPTAGLDPNSRNLISETIKSLKDEGKTIIIATHHLEEADELADKVIVISRGKLVAMGTPDFIKKRFSAGYHIILTPKYEGEEYEYQFFQVKEFMSKAIFNMIPNSKRLDQPSDYYLKFVLPSEERRNFAELFELFEKYPTINTTLEMLSLEEAILNLEREEEAILSRSEQETIDPNQIELPSSLNISVQMKPNKQIWAMFLRKFYYAYNIKFQFFSALMPCLIVYLILTLILREYGVLKLDLWKKPITIIIMSSLGVLNSVLIVYEKERHIRDILNSMGCHPLCYWIGNTIYDFLIISFNLGILQSLSMRNWDNPLLTQGLFSQIGFILAFSFSFVSTSYLFSFLFSSMSAVYKLYLPSFLTTIFTSFIAYYFLPNLYLYVFPTHEHPGILTLLSPLFGLQVALSINQQATYNIAELIMILSLGGILSMLCILVLEDLKYSYVRVFQIVNRVMSLLKDLIIKLKKILAKAQRVKPKKGKSKTAGTLEVEFSIFSMDQREITEEKRRVTSDGNKDPIKVIDVSKEFKPGMVVLDQLTYSVDARQIFCLIGPSGAGKSTLLGISSLMLPQTSGEIFLRGNKANHRSHRIMQQIGICTQFDSLWEDFTVRQHLVIYGTLKGFNKWDLENNIRYLSEVMKIKKHIFKKAKHLSEGLKRKVTIMNALVGTPSLIYLDEPSTGLDISSKRNFWSMINFNLLTKNASVCLTTQSIYEAETLGHKIGFIINGKFVCIGPAHYLELKYGSGYKISLKKGPKYDEKMIYEMFPKAEKINDPLKINQSFHVGCNTFKFSEAFRFFEELRKKQHILDFALSITRLDQVYNHFAKYQNNLEV